MSLLSMLGLNLPGLGTGNHFNGLLGSGASAAGAGSATGGFNSILPTLVEAIRGTTPHTGGVPEVAPATTRPLPPEYAANGTTQAQWAAMNTPDAGVPKTVTSPAATPAATEPPNWPSIQAGIFKGESGGDYNKLFANSETGPFSGTKLTNMTVDQAIQFASPQGPYGQWVQGKIGRVATPMGAYQIVGSTLQNVKKGMGLTGSELMTPDLQDTMGKYILKTQGTGAWEGYRGPATPGSGTRALPAYGPTSNELSRPSGSQSAMLPPSSGLDLTGDYNTALANPKGGSGRRGGGSPPKGSPDAPGGGGTQKNSVSPDFKRFQSRKDIRQLRGLSPVATIMALENIGKGLRTQGGGKA